MQAKDSLDTFYKVMDPWGYRRNPDDRVRKENILAALEPNQYQRALDIGAGEGFITEDLPANEVHAIEWSDRAARRLAEHITRVGEPEGKYDLVVATGVLYPHYHYGRMHWWIDRCASKTVLTCNIKAWEVPLESKHLKQVHEEEFPYREYVQKLRIYESTA